MLELHDVKLKMATERGIKIGAVFGYLRLVNELKCYLCFPTLLKICFEKAKKFAASGTTLLGECKFIIKEKKVSLLCLD